MRIAVLDTVLVAAVFAVLLGFEWRYRRLRLRVGAALLALVVLALYQPGYTGARRRALGAQPSERVTRLPRVGSEGYDSLSQYESGVYTTMQAVVDAADFGAGARLVAVGALFWLACSPAFRHARGLSEWPGARPIPDSGAPEA